MSAHRAGADTPHRDRAPEGPHAVVYEALTRALGGVLGLARPGGTAWFAVVSGRIVLGDRALAAFTPTGPPSPPFRWSPDDHTFPEPFRCVAVPGPPEPLSPAAAALAASGVPGAEAGAVLVGVGPGCCGPAGSGTGTRVGGPTPDDTEPAIGGTRGGAPDRETKAGAGLAVPCTALPTAVCDTCGAWVHCPAHAECPWCPQEAPPPGHPGGLTGPATLGDCAAGCGVVVVRGGGGGCACGAATTVPTPKALEGAVLGSPSPVVARLAALCVASTTAGGLAANDEWRLELWSRALPTPPAVRGIAETLAARGGRGRTAEARRLAMAAHTLGTDCSDILRATEPPDRKRGRDG
jgi:hypothetical protein